MTIILKCNKLGTRDELLARNGKKTLINRKNNVNATCFYIDVYLLRYE